MTNWLGIGLGVVILAAGVAYAPAAALAVPAVLVGAYACRRYPAAAVTVTVAISGLYGSLIAFWHLPVEQLINVSIGALLIATLVSGLNRRRPPALPWPATLALLLYVATTAAGLLTSPDFGIALEAASTSVWYIVLALLIGYAAWPQTTQDRIVRGILVVAALVGGYAIYRWIAGPAAQERAVATQTYFNFVAGKLRVFGSFPSPQDLGVWTAGVAPFCAAVALAWRSTRWRLLAASAGTLCVMAMLLSELRIALAGVVGGLAVVLALYSRSRGLPGVRLGTTMIAVATAAAVIVGAFVVTGRSAGDATHSYGALLHSTRSDPSVDARLYKWDQAFVDLRNHPLGYGVGTASFAEQQSGRFYLNVGAYNVDNGYLKIALEQGFAVMVLFILILLGLIAGLARRALRAADRREASVAIGACGTLVSVAIILNAGAFLDAPRALAAWVIVGLGLAPFTYRRSTEPTAQRSTLPS